MRLIVSLLLLVGLIVGCGTDPDAPVYDTKANPDGFPQIALELINDLEAGQLSEFDQIVNRFADLYTEESALLDNQDWKGIIDRLGVKFQFRAEAALERGLTGYNEAAANFMLASFAHPENQELGRLGRLFSTWSGRVGKDTTGLFAGLTQAGLLERIKVLRQFELSDSLSRVFSNEYLRPVILGEKGIAGFTADQISQLSEVDRSLLAYAELAPYESSRMAASWEEPSISLVAAEVSLTRPGWYLVEMYFTANSRLDKDFTIALRAMTEDTLPSISDVELNYIPFDFSPVIPTSRWADGQIIAAAKQIYFDQTFKRLRIGLYQRGIKGSQLKLSGSDQSLYQLMINPETK